MEFTQNRLAIRPLEEWDSSLLYKWLIDPRVLSYYEGRDRPQNMDMVYARNIRRNDKDPMMGCLVSWDSVPVGYVQTYPIMGEELMLYGYSESLRVYGMDQFLGKPDMWNQGIGTELVKVVSNRLHQEHRAEIVVMDPRVENQRAIHVYEKCGFKKIRVLPKRELHGGMYHDCWLIEYAFTIRGYIVEIYI